MDATIETHGPAKRYGGTFAVDDLSIAVRSGRDVRAAPKP